MKESPGATFPIAYRSSGDGERDIEERKCHLLVLSQTDDFTESRRHRGARERDWEEAVHLCEDLRPGFLETESIDESLG